jgi:proton-translocating NADH-quinone oxidoreductase chain N
MIQEILLPLLIPFAGAIIIALLGILLRKAGVEKVTGYLAALVALGTIASVIYFYQLVSQQGVITFHYLFEPPGGACLRVDMLSWFMSLVFSNLGFLVTIYSIAYMEKDTGLDKYYALLLALIGGMNLVVYAGDLFTLFVAWELMSVSSYALVSFRKESWEPVEAGFKYLVMSAFGSATLLYAISLIYGLTGTLSYEAVHQALQVAKTDPSLYLIVGMLIIGFGVKASIVPLHTWLPDAHPAAPSSISAMLSGVVIKNGVYGILRVLLLAFPVTVLDYGTIVAVFAVLTMTVGNIMALLQEDIKRLLAYSSIVNIGYIFAGLAVGMMNGVGETAAVIGVAGGLLHVLNHSLMKGMLFLCAGAFIHELGTRNLEELKGIGRKMPITAFCFFMGCLAIAGVPGLSGFVSKFMIIWGAVVGGQLVLAALTLINSAFSVVYYLRLIHIILFAEPSKEMEHVKEAPISILIPIVILTIQIIFIGIWPRTAIEVVEKAAEAVLKM